jgi:hypothetical protein
MDPDDRQPLTSGLAREESTPPVLVQGVLPADGVSFLQPPPPTQHDSNPVVLAALASHSFALLLVLALQIAVHERDQIAASYPSLASPLEHLCEPLNCSVKALRRIEAIVIDSSSFTRVGGSVFRLSVSLKNMAGLALALPSIELTLTDAQDNVLVRRVFEPEDLLTGAEAIKAGSEWSPSLEVVLASPVATAVNGYRLVAFYP